MDAILIRGLCKRWERMSVIWLKVNSTQRQQTRQEFYLPGCTDGLMTAQTAILGLYENAKGVYSGREEESG